MKGIVLAGGSGTRLYPLTQVVSKQLLPVYDKPMIYYPLSMLMLSGIRDILIISTPEDTPRFQSLLGDGSRFGLNGMRKRLLQAVENAENGRASVFGYFVNDPHRFGVVEFDKNEKVISIEEKPKEPKSNYAVTGLYFYPKGVSKKAKEVKPSPRGELEITTLNQMYLNEETLDVILLGRGFTWLDTGTTDSLIEAASFVQLMQTHQGIVMSCLEEIAYKRGWISKEEVLKTAKLLEKNAYGKHLKNVVEDKIVY